jgi:preprotein translocase subunit SecD
MNKNLTWKWIVIAAVLVLFVFGIFGIPKDVSGKGLAAALTDRIHLGLDLRGGTHLILQVQVNDAVNVDSDNAIARLKEDMRTHKISYADITKPDPVNHPETVIVKGVPPEQTSDFKSLVTDRLPDYDASSGAENSWTVSMKKTNLADLKNRAVEQAIETIRNRIDALGVSEPVIQEHGLGQYQILVQLPGVDDPARVKEIMQSTAMLEIKQSLGGPFPSEQAALQDKGGVLPPDAVLLPGKSIGSRNDNGGENWYLISRASAVTGRDLRTAEPTTDENGQPAVRFILTSDGGRKFYSFTSSHVGDNLAVTLDNKVQEVAVIKEAIRDTGIINGRFTQQEVQDLSMTLRSGALPAGIKYLEERTVGPSLGADSIKSGVRAAIAGMLAVLIFMLIYYRWAGVNADIALI